MNSRLILSLLFAAAMTFIAVASIIGLCRDFRALRIAKEIKAATSKL